MEISKELFIDIVNNSKTRREICLKLNLSITSSHSYRKINKLIEEYNLNISHLYNKELFGKKYDKIEKTCPICEKIFITRNGHKREKTTCTRKCANTYFRSGENHPNWKVETYRTTCFGKHKKECVVCGENKIVEVHHLDGNKNNNSIYNLIPICPTHHRYWHSRYKKLVEVVVLEYIKKFKMLN